MNKEYGITENTLTLCFPWPLSIDISVANKLPKHLRPRVPWDHRGRFMDATKHSTAFRFRDKLGFQ
jgi:hypothetical protein